MAYYPLFAWLWKLSGLGPFGISILNWCITLTSTFFISRELKIPLGQIVIFWSFPSAVFCMVPYSEALFILGGAFILIGLHNNRLAILLIGVTLACLTRSIGAILSLCFLFTYIFNVSKSYSTLDHLKSISTIVLPVVINGIVQWYQFYHSGVRFDYIDVQAQWGRVLDFPGLPLTARLFPSTAWVDYLALFIGIASALLILRLFYQKLSNTTLEIGQVPIFSLLYLAGVTCVVLLFSRKDGSGSTVIASLNRFVFASPYFLVFLNAMLTEAKSLTKKEVLLTMTVLLVLEWALLTFGVSMIMFHLKWQVYFVITLAVPLAYYLVLVKPKLTWWVPLYMISTLLQAYFLGLFIAERWIG
ncbi:MAG: hypothetical protein RIF33_15230 [Cyclobacteriaceae bacterium]